MKKKLSQYQPRNRKEVLKTCYGFYRELLGYGKILDACDDNKDYGLIYSRVLQLRYHINTYFSDDVISACENMWAESQNDLDKYGQYRWVHFQANKAWGSGIDTWRRAKRVEFLFGKNGDIPF